MRIHLIRHGQTEWNKEGRMQGHSESALTQEGREQAAALAPVLAGWKIGKIYCSASLRARQTAEILFADQHIEMQFENDLREMYLGPWEGMLQEDIRATDPLRLEQFWQRPHQFQLEGAETFQQLQVRGVDRLRAVLQERAAEDVAIISHGALIKAILCHLQSRPLAALWEPPAMHNCAHSIVCDEGRMTPDVMPRIIQYAGIAM